MGTYALASVVGPFSSGGLLTDQAELALDISLSISPSEPQRWCSSGPPCRISKRGGRRAPSIYPGIGVIVAASVPLSAGTHLAGKPVRLGLARHHRPLRRLRRAARRLYPHWSSCRSIRYPVRLFRNPVFAISIAILFLTTA